VIWGREADEVVCWVEEAGFDLGDGVLCCEVGAVSLDVGEGGGREGLSFGEGGENLVWGLGLVIWFWRLGKRGHTIVAEFESDLAEDVGLVPLELTASHELGSSGCG